MTTRLVTAPTIEPLTLDEAKDHLRVLGGDFDSYIVALIQAAREWCEVSTRQTALTTTWKRVLRNWPSDGVIELDRPPLASVTSIVYVDTDGNSQTLATSEYSVDTASRPGVVRRGYGVTWPTVRTTGVAEPVAITYVAGYTQASDVPESFKHAMKLTIAHWFENREQVGPGNMSELPMGVNALLASISHGSYP